MFLARKTVQMTLVQNVAQTIALEKIADSNALGYEIKCDEVLAALTTTGTLYIKWGSATGQTAVTTSNYDLRFIATAPSCLVPCAIPSHAKSFSIMSDGATPVQTVYVGSMA